jgi:hypothetical protein
MNKQKYSFFGIQNTDKTDDHGLYGFKFHYLRVFRVHIKPYLTNSQMDDLSRNPACNYSGFLSPGSSHSQDQGCSFPA